MPTNKKRTKLVWNRDKRPQSWEKFPLVILEQAIRKQAWFKNGDVRFYSSLPYNEAKKRFETDQEGYGPTDLLITQPYKTTTLKVRVMWTFEETRCSIHLSDPLTFTYFPSGGAPKQTKSRYIEGALKRIEEAFIIATPEADKEIKQQEEKERKTTEATKYHNTLCEELGVTLSCNRYEPYNFVYGKGRTFGMRFVKDMNAHTETFCIESIKGRFTKEEIKQFIKFIGGNPRAIADRLTSKKR